MIKPSKTQTQRLLTFLENHPTDFRPAVRWLLLGRDLAESLMSEIVQEPDLDQLLGLLRLLKDQEPELIDTATLLVAASRHGAQLPVEIQLDALVDRDPKAWGHPVQILLRPRSPYPVLLAACQRRLETAEDAASNERLLSVAGKLGRAIELEERARRRRQLQRAKEHKEHMENSEGGGEEH